MRYNPNFIKIGKSSDRGKNFKIKCTNCKKFKPGHEAKNNVCKECQRSAAT